ncbi:hypothetical protein O6H91_09G118200 [Diphasiastrum complanatum]|uniref:Uncharacterized protein n=1 Tax=Diphasiastrum complanatum TaxID=34168 RepID=A0ACC2CTX9_DIPCM|nr:hypothetical protein O6H91_09G118200 [Diphasiastrum complanatum]
MATQVGLATSKLLILVGAGVTGSMLLKNGRLSDFLSDLSKVLVKHLKEEEKNTSRDGADIAANLSAQVNRLSQELRQLAGSRSITVVNGTANQTGSISSYALPVIFVGAAGYGYFWWKGWSWTDVMYVTKKNMSNAVASVTKQLEQLSTALSATKRQLASRLDLVSKTLDDSMQVQGLIKDQVVEVHGEVVRVGGEIENVQRIVEGLEVKLDAVQYKQDFTNQGIVLLCQFVQGLEGVQRQDLLQGFSPLSKPHLERSTSSALPAPAGLKELQAISEALSKGSYGGATKKPTAGSNVEVLMGGPGLSLQRTYTPTFPFGYTRLPKT